jgi:hypothetical protein
LTFAFVQSCFQALLFGAGEQYEGGRRQPSIAFLTRTDLTRHEPPPLVAHDYPWRECRANFTTARGSQGS